MTPGEGGALERGWASGHLVNGQRWGGPPKVGLGWARTLEKNELGGITEVLLQGQRGAGTPRGSHRRGGGRLLGFQPRFPLGADLPPSLPSAAQWRGARLTQPLAAECPGEGPVPLWVSSLDRKGLPGPRGGLASPLCPVLTLGSSLGSPKSPSEQQEVASALG